MVVKGHFAGPGAVEPSLHERGPGVLQQETPADVILADPGRPGEHSLPTVMLHSIFPEEKIGEIANVVG